MEVATDPRPTSVVEVSHKRHTVMIVEDEAIVALHLKVELEELGYAVSGIASTGSQALRMIDDEVPDVILMDIHLPGKLDGIQTAHLIPSYLHVPVIYLTAYSEDSTLNRAGDTNPYGYLIKPFLSREVHAAIKMALVRRKAEESARAMEGFLLRSLCSTPVTEC